MGHDHQADHAILLTRLPPTRAVQARLLRLMAQPSKPRQRAGEFAGGRRLQGVQHDQRKRRVCNDLRAWARHPLHIVAPPPRSAPRGRPATSAGRRGRGSRARAPRSGREACQARGRIRRLRRPRPGCGRRSSATRRKPSRRRAASGRSCPRRIRRRLGRRASRRPPSGRPGPRAAPRPPASMRRFGQADHEARADHPPSASARFSAQMRPRGRPRSGARSKAPGPSGRPNAAPWAGRCRSARTRSPGCRAAPRPLVLHRDHHLAARALGR